MKHSRFEAELTENSSCMEIPLVRRAGAVLGAGAMAILAAAAIGVYAFIGGKSIPSDNSRALSAQPAATEASAQAVTESAEDQTISTDSQAAVTWKKAGIEEYDLVIETVKATKKSKTSAKTTEEKTSVSETETEKAPDVTVIPTDEVPKTEEQADETQNEPESTVERDVKSCASMTMVTNDKVNMRKAASLDADVITVIEADSEISVTGYTDNWYRIRYDSKTGYCMKRYADELVEETEEEPSDVISYTDAEFDMLCCVIQCEVGDCSDASKTAVTNVVINRVKSSAFPDTLEGVLTQPNQFDAIYSYYSGGVVPTQSTIDCVKRALSGEDNSNGAIYYYAPAYCGSSSASWFESLTFCAEIDGQRYFK
ncbi:MAG: cell wall hydrolase [Oscillospiraceae bacterium]